MSKPVFVFFCIEKFTEAWYQLSKEEQDNLFVKLGELNKKYGVKGLIYCDSRWGNEATSSWGVEEYADLDSYQKKVEEQEKLELWRYLSSKTIFGTKME